MPSYFLNSLDKNKEKTTLIKELKASGFQVYLKSTRPNQFIVVPQEGMTPSDTENQLERILQTLEGQNLAWHTCIPNPSEESPSPGYQLSFQWLDSQQSSSKNRHPKKIQQIELTLKETKVNLCIFPTLPEEDDYLQL